MYALKILLYRSQDPDLHHLRHLLWRVTQHTMEILLILKCPYRVLLQSCDFRHPGF
jgi:hypothetical protein